MAGPSPRAHDTRDGVSGVLLVFLDGVGIGPSDPDVNPFLRVELPTFSRLMGGRIRTLDDLSGLPDGVAAVDATLGHDGTPQSGTGQAALLTGMDAVARHGGHFGPWTPVGLRPLVEHESVLRRAVDLGATVAFANAYPRGWPGERGGRRVAGPPLAARGAGLLTRHEEALGAGDAVSSEIVNDGWKRHLGFEHLPDPAPDEAGANLAGIANAHDLTLYAHYATDTAGHRGGMDGAVAALERVDRFLAGLLEGLAPSVMLLVASDHGNIEDVRTGHTLNPALGIVRGPGARETSRLGSLMDVTPFVLERMGLSDAD